jgi:hypothetical protein
MHRPFPSFEAIYQLEDPLMDEPYRGALGLPHDAARLATRGEYLPESPVPVYPSMGPDLWEVIWMDNFGPMAVLDQVVDLLRAQSFTGWSTYSVAVHDWSGILVPRYFGFAVTGRCGPIDYRRSRLVNTHTMIPDYVGLYFDPTTWDGSDFFFSDRASPFVVAEVKDALEQAGVPNLKFTPLPDVRTPQLAVDGLPVDSG